MTPIQLTSGSVLILNFDFCNASFSVFASKVGQVYLLEGFEHVLTWSEMCTVQNIVGVTNDGLLEKQRRLRNLTSIFPPPASLCTFSSIEMFWKFKI